MPRIALAQMKVQPGHPDQNVHTMLRMIEEARMGRADLVLFPEMAIPGYLLGDAWESDAFLRDLEAYGQEIIRASHDLTILFGNVAVDWKKRNNDGRPRKYNALFIAQNGQLIAPDSMPYPFLIKTLLPNYREFDDTRHFFSLQKLAQELGTTAEKLLSPISLNLGGKTVRFGAMLCEDGWSENYQMSPMQSLHAKGPVDFFVNISSSPYTLGKNDKRHRLFGKEAQMAQAPLFYVNNVGLQNNGKTLYTFDGSSTVYASNGAPVLIVPAYQERLVVVDLAGIQALPAIPRRPHRDVEHIHRALRYGVQTFLESIHMQRVVIGISGGIDSAVAAALYTEILGAKNVLLVNMPSVFNSATTKGLAQQLAKNLGCQYAVFPIQEAVDLTVRQIDETPVVYLANGTEQQLRASSFVIENIQARDRSARILAGVAAAFGGGFTCNANKAETTVGYSTLYGDQSGFLAALADLWKYQVYDLARYLNEAVYHKEVIPQGIIDIVPSAELSSAQNVDEGKGDPIKYPYHDYLFRAFVERWEKAIPEDILHWYVAGTLEKNIGAPKGVVKEYFPTPRAFIADLERWWNLFTGMAIAKRIQAPPILAVSRRAYGFDHREAQNGPYYTKAYCDLKARLLQSEGTK